MGLFEAIFGKGAPKDDTAPKQSFYLNDDDAKSFGDIEYMRSNKTVRRTFAKKKGQDHMESVREISALKKANVDGSSVKGQASYGVSETNGGVAPSVSTPQPQPEAAKTRRRPASKDMDMFRDMAKKIGK